MPPSIKAGIAVSLTGQFRNQGRQALAGLQAWAGDVNRAGGLAGAGRPRPVSVLHYDDASLADGARQATRRLVVQDRVDLLFGPYSSGLARAAAAVAAEHGRTLWNQGGAAGEIHQSGRRVVGILTPAGQYLAALPGLVRRAAPEAATFALVRCSAGAFPRQVSDGLEAAALALGFRKTLHREYPPGATDFSTILDQVEAVRPDLLLAVGRIRHDVALADGVSRRRPGGRMPRVTAVVAAPVREFQAALGDRVEGFIGPSQWEPPPERPADGAFPPGYAPDYGPAAAQVMRSLERESRRAGGLAVDYPMAQAYAAGLVAQRCVAAAGALEDAALWQAATGLDFSTFYGRFRIDPETGQQVGRSVAIIQWQGGRKAIIWPPEQYQAAIALG